MVTSLLNLKKPARVGMKTIHHMRCHFADGHDVADDRYRATLGNRLPCRLGQLVMIANDVIDLIHGGPAVR